MQLLTDFIRASAWEMEPPEAYGAFHIVFTLVGFTVCAFAAWRLRGLGEKGSRRLIFLCGLFLALSEVYKQLFYRVCLWNGSYNWGIFPMHLCSVPMYLCLIAPLLPKGRAQGAMYSFMGFYNLLGGGIAFAEPSGLCHAYWTLTLHAFTWHLVLVFLGLFLCFSGRADKEHSSYAAATGTFLALCLLAFALNVALRTASGGELNAFFIGPADSPIIVFDYISERLGWFASTALYIPAVCFGAWLIFLAQRQRRKVQA